MLFLNDRCRFGIIPKARGECLPFQFAKPVFFCGYVKDAP